MKLEIRHKIMANASDFTVTEKFGDQAERRWKRKTLADAERLVAGRKAHILRMVANISPAAKHAVAEHVETNHIESFKAGHA